jgi:hypothetical protein
MPTEGRLRRLPAPWLSPDEFPRLNAAFYSAEPHSFLRARVAILAVAAAKPEVIQQALSDGLDYRGLQVGAMADANEGVEVADEDHEREREEAFVISDAVSVLHHASETLLRFYLAHAPGIDGKVSPCPWIEMAQALSHAQLKKRHVERFDGLPLDDARFRELAIVFYVGRPEQEHPQGEQIKKSIESIEQWLTHFAGVFVQDAHLFNALKHGLAVRAGSASMQIQTPADEGRETPLIQAKGSSVAFLEQAGDDRLWHETTRWVRPDRMLAEADVAARMLENIWRVGRIRYLKEDPIKHPLRFWDTVNFDDYIRSQLDGGESAQIITTKMSMNVLYRYAYPPSLVCTRCRREPRKGKTRGVSGGGWNDSTLPRSTFYAQSVGSRTGANTLRR